MAIRQDQLIFMPEKKKILLVDDDQKNIFALRLTLSSRGYACVCAQDAREAINKLHEQQQGIGLVLMDMMMPEMDGYEAITHIKEDKQISDIPVVAVTAQAMAGDREKCLEAGAVAYLSKPIDVDELLTVILKHFNNSND